MDRHENRLKKLTDVTARGEGIISASVACCSKKSYGRLLDDVGALLEGGLNQLLLIFYAPENMRVASIAPAEVAATRNSIAGGTYEEAFFDTAAAVRAAYPELPLIASGVVPDVVTYGIGRFLQRIWETGVDAIDTPNYKAVADPIGLAAQTLAAGGSYIPPITTSQLRLELPEHQAFLSETARIGREEIFFIPGVSGETKRITGAQFVSMVDCLREKQRQQGTNGVIISISGINTPEDAYQLTHVAGTDGVHFSSAYLNRVTAGTPANEIIAWLKEVKCAMNR